MASGAVCVSSARVTPTALGVRTDAMAAPWPMGARRRISASGLGLRTDGGAAWGSGISPCTLHVVGKLVIAIGLPARAGLPGATLCPLCFEHLGGDKCPGGLAATKAR